MDCPVYGGLFKGNDIVVYRLTAGEHADLRVRTDGLEPGTGSLGGLLSDVLTIIGEMKEESFPSSASFSSRASSWVSVPNSLPSFKAR